MNTFRTYIGAGLMGAVTAGAFFGSAYEWAGSWIGLTVLAGCYMGRVR